MTNNTNIYDIDGNIIRAAGDTHELTPDEAKVKIEEYQSKLKQLADNEEDALKAGVYKTYIRNLQRYVFNYYMAHPEALPRTTVTEEQIKKAMEDLKAEVDKDETESTPDTMDEYVDFQEVKDEQ